MDMLNSRAEQAEGEGDVFVLGYQRWLEDDYSRKDDLEGLLSNIRDAKSIKSGPTRAYPNNQEQRNVIMAQTR